jgi:2-isopropylmalate synthase
LEYDNDDDATADSKPSAAKAIRSSRRRTKLCVAEGNGPVNALANALQLALNERFPQLKRIHLVDYQVDLLSSEGTSAAVTRVTMDFVDRGGGGTWRTVGAHASIIEASFRALVDGMEYGIAQCGADGCVVGEVGVEAREGAPETTAR